MWINRRKMLFSLLILCITLSLIVTGCGKKDEAVDNEVYVKTQKVTADMQSSEDTYSGTVKGRYENDLSFQVGGKIIQRNINIGDKVAAGDVLMVIDDKDVKQSVNAADAQVASATSQLNLAKSDLARYQQLYAANAVSAQQLDQAQASYDNAVATYNQAVAQASQSENSLGYTQLIADNAGVISNVTGEVGQVVAAGQAVATLVHDGDREVEISVPENKIQTISVGQNASVTFWALNNTQVDGTVREISPIADDVARTYKVRISLNNMPADIQLGMTANVSFSDINNAVSGIKLPLAALYQTENKTQVWIVDGDDQLMLKDVQVVSLGKNDVIVNGLNEDDIVVTAGVHKLHEGQKVKLLDGDAL